MTAIFICSGVGMFLGALCYGMGWRDGAKWSWEEIREMDALKIVRPPNWLAKQTKKMRQNDYAGHG